MDRGSRSNLLLDAAALHSPAGSRFEVSGVSIPGISSRSNAPDVDLPADSPSSSDDRGALADGSGRGHHDIDAPLVRLAGRHGSQGREKW